MTKLTDLARAHRSGIRAENKYMQIAIEEALEGIQHRHGGPFGSVVVKDGQIVGKGHNMVLGTNDPTRHGEMEAIRDASKNLGTHDLSGCELYTTGEPCPMCLGACLWANISKVYYGCTIHDNEKIGFRDEDFRDYLGITDKLHEFLVCTDRPACLRLFNVYMMTDPESY